MNQSLWWIKKKLERQQKLRIKIKELLLLQEENRARKNRPLSFKNTAPISGYISKINGVLVYNAGDLDVVMPMYNLIEYSKNYRKTIASL